MDGDINNKIYINDQVSIYETELHFRFSTSGGPGGQHANRSATKVTLLFDVAGSPSLDEEVRTRLLQKLATRLDKQGVLSIDVQESRSQRKNRETAIARFQSLLAGALIKRKKRRKSKPSRAAKEKRLSDKKKRSSLKQNRSRQWPKEE